MVEYIIIIMYYRSDGGSGVVASRDTYRRQKQSSTKQTLVEIKSRDLARFL